jgi:uncharacterized membrane protein
MNWKRLLRHWMTDRRSLHRTFPGPMLLAIEAAVGEAERRHAGQIRVVLEASLETRDLLSGLSARERALEVFSQMRVWDTEHNNGVLIYLLLADHDVEIVADRGIHRHCGSAVWEDICHRMEAEFRAGRFEQGVLAGIEAVAAQLSVHYPPAAGAVNELPDRPVLM